MSRPSISLFLRADNKTVEDGPVDAGLRRERLNPQGSQHAALTGGERTIEAAKHLAE